jgi:DNA-binding NarL/FixJ family response regulator
MKVLLADDHRMMREGLRALLEKEGIEVAGEAANGREAIALALRERPDVVVMDIAMPEMNGIDATKRLAVEAPEAKVVALSMNADRRYVVAMFAAGAFGYLLKNGASSELIQAVKAAARGQKYVSPAIASVVVSGMIERASPADSKAAQPLSPREREVLQLLAEGCSSKEIAHRLTVAVATVETHRRQIMAKLGLRSVAELTKYAIREGLTSVQD